MRSIITFTPWFFKSRRCTDGLWETILPRRRPGSLREKGAGALTARLSAQCKPRELWDAAMDHGPAIKVQATNGSHRRIQHTGDNDHVLALAILNIKHATLIFGLIFLATLRIHPSPRSAKVQGIVVRCRLHIEQRFILGQLQQYPRPRMRFKVDL